MIEKSAFTDINQILTNTYLNYKEYWLLSVNYQFVLLISVNIGLLNFLL